MPEPAQTATSSPTGATPGAFIDPYRSYNFKLEILGVTEGHFTYCAGFEVDVPVLSYREGGGGPVVHKLPGPVTYGDVTLRYGLTTSTELWTWLMTAVRGNVERRNVSILMLDSAGANEVLRWDLLNAWPSRWRGAVLDALGREVAIEQLTLVFES